ncbi:proline-, glutamic acid- and leucine-rich protein 1-like [Selaginella moellendorffii]|uniref:proline-, glutamic acid- and leucine-rich protein 1-like n=1 Tax=Selaginella moellendorffii TaxID=88036 RepID=UPI000D1CB721|nr:proline-, glutamic acid- and leucine-rich protein 1-like [Selaginella moellendorffii]|eukprot:XP_024538703.1 proline-, glutamic acid- and leucine-rich protein 1-like [Selaginella moellendorffii]
MDPGRGPHDYQGWGVSRRIGWHHHHFRPPVPVPPSPLPFAPAPAPFPSPITPTPFPSPTPSPTIPTPFPSPTPSPTPTPTISPASTKTTALLSLIPFVVFVGVVALVAFGLWWVFERKRKDDGDGDREKHETRVELGFISCRNEAELQQAEDGLLREKEGDFAIDVGVQECSEAPIHHVDSIQTSSKERVGDINSCHAQESSETIQTSSEDKACEIEELGHAKEQGGGGNNRCRKSQFGRSLAAEYVDAAMACIRNDGTGTNSSFTVVRMRTALIKLTRAMEILKAESSEHEGLSKIFQ